MNHRRASGILLHVTSLPALPDADGCLLDAGSGDFGASTYAFVDWLVAAGQSLWQVLPFNPAGPGNSPYTSVSAHAGNPWLISLANLAHEGLIDRDALAQTLAVAGPHTSKIDFAASARVRMRFLRQAATRFKEMTSSHATLHEEFENWCQAERAWLDDYALFMALRMQHDPHAPWTTWPAEFVTRDRAALHRAATALAEEIFFWRFVQWSFSRQWTAIREYAHARGIRIVGDMPIYVAWDSADVWADPALFELDDAFKPIAVAGVPPDYFSTTGQLWGNPLYRWQAHAADDYRWWRARLRSALRHADLVRIDHFRAFESYWAVAADACNAVAGQWRSGPGQALFAALARDLQATGTLPLIAEDLGTITPAVIALRAAVGIPGMRVLQFAFGGDADDLNLPHNLPEDCAVYCGTHDNDTALGWFASVTRREQDFARIYLKSDGREIGWDMIHAASASCARYAVYPLHDVLGLDSSARMNVPGVAQGQWGWRFAWEQIEAWQTHRLRQISAVHGRNRIAIEFDS